MSEKQKPLVRIYQEIDRTVFSMSFGDAIIVIDDYKDGGLCLLVEKQDQREIFELRESPPP